MLALQHPGPLLHAVGVVVFGEEQDRFEVAVAAAAPGHRSLNVFLSGVEECGVVSCVVTLIKGSSGI